jgi:tetratricopeptide (TPR) repeat protein
LLRRLLLTAAASAALITVSHAQQQPQVSLDVSPTLFTVTAALNSCGYDQELSLSHPLRAAMRSEVARAIAASPEAVAAQKQFCGFYHDHFQGDAAQTVSQYISLALNLTEPPDLRLAVPENQLPPDAAYVQGSVATLARLYQEAGLQRIWDKHRAAYDQLIEENHAGVSRTLLETNVYLKMPLTGYLARGFRVLLEPMVAPGLVNARVYGNDYVLVTSPAGGVQLDQVRHMYLHFLLDALALKRVTAMNRLAPLLVSVDRAPLDKRYKEDIALLVTESLIRAIEARTAAKGKEAEPVRQQAVDTAMRSGFILTRYFYDALVEFEKDPVSLRDAYGNLLYNIMVDKERRRAAGIQFASEAAPEVLRASKPTQASLLDVAEERLAASDYRAAEKLAREAMEQQGGDAGRALFVLARAAALNRDIEGARTYFERATEVAGDARIKAWSHIYLGRMLDMRENREAAVRHYKAALAMSEGAPDARSAAERGLASPYAPGQPGSSSSKE